jgi:hypothetical protein
LVAEDVVNCAVRYNVYQSSTLAQPATQDRMIEVGLRLLKTGYSKTLRHTARTQSLYLWEDKPHPMGALLARSKLGTYLREAGVLSIDETLQTIRIVSDQ